MQILGHLGMYFDAVVVEVEKYFFSVWLWPFCEDLKSDNLQYNMLGLIDQSSDGPSIILIDWK